MGTSVHLGPPGHRCHVTTVSILTLNCGNKACEVSPLVTGCLTRVADVDGLLCILALSTFCGPAVARRPDGQAGEMNGRSAGAFRVGSARCGRSDGCRFRHCRCCTGPATALAAAPAPGGRRPGSCCRSPPPPVVLTPFTPPANRYGAGHRGVDLAAARGPRWSPPVPGWSCSRTAGRPRRGVDRARRRAADDLRAGHRCGAAGWRVAPVSRSGCCRRGTPGCAPAVCLHWGARLPDQVYLDPMALLGPWRVRLLPWDGL